MIQDNGTDSGGLWIVAGLGNPGRRYARSRHNAGFLAMDRIESVTGIKVKKVRFKSLIGEGMVEGRKVVLVKPQTFMNLSGEAVLDAVGWYKPDMSRLIIIYDDADLEFGRIRIRKSGSAGTHNGMKSIIQLLGTEDFPRIRIGIGRTPEGFDMADYVLSPFGDEEAAVIDEAAKNAADAAVHAVLHGIDSAMGRYNIPRIANSGNDTEC